MAFDGRKDRACFVEATVGDVLAAEDISLGEHDQVLPGLDEKVSNGSVVSLRYGRELEVTVDGTTSTYWTNEANVSAALDALGVAYRGADLSVSRSAAIGRDGMALDLVTPKHVVVRVGGHRAEHQKLTALTVRDALEALGIRVHKHDRVRPGLNSPIADGDRLDDGVGDRCDSNDGNERADAPFQGLDLQGGGGCDLVSGGGGAPAGWAALALLLGLSRRRRRRRLGPRPRPRARRAARR